MENKHTLEELKQKQALPLKRKIQLTKQRIKEWYNHYNGQVCVSFSGGVDSVVLLDLARQCYPNMKAIFSNTGLEYPENREIVKLFNNIDIITAPRHFLEVVTNDGWVFPSKDVASAVYYYKRGSEWAIRAFKGLDKNNLPSAYKKDRFAVWFPLVAAPFPISHRCCIEMKEKPIYNYLHKNKLYTMIGTLAEESSRRTLGWLRSGCNSFHKRHAISKPLSFWTKQDIWEYTVQNNLPISGCYGSFERDKNGLLKPTGLHRTGCMFCLIGCHLEKGQDRRFIQLKEMHPKIYKGIMKTMHLNEKLDYITKLLDLKENLY